MRWRRLRRLSPALLLALTIAVGLGERAPAGTAQPSASAALTPLAAVNQLLATAWAPLAKQRADDQEVELERLLEDVKLAGGDGTKSGVKWELSLWLRNVNATIDLSSPPAFTRASRSGFTFEQSRQGFDFSLAGDVAGKASVKVAGEKIFTWSPGLHFGFRIKDFKVVADATLDSTRPNRPRVTSTRVRASVAVGGDGFLPISIPISFTTETQGETVTLRGRMTGVSLREELSGLDAKLTADLVISLLPRGVVDVNAPDPQLGVDVDDVPIKGDFRTVKVSLSGRLTAGLKRVGSVSVPFRGFDFAIPFPSSQSLDQTLRQVSGEPNRWGDTVRPPYALPPLPAEALAPETLTTHLAELEAGAALHAPHGAVLSFDPAPPPRAATPGPRYTYGNDEDSSLFTGQYLAAESFRYAATQSPASLDRVKSVLEGLRRLFWVTQDAAVAVDGAQRVTKPVSSSSGRRATMWRGLLARTAKPTTDTHGYTVARDRHKSGPLEQRPCHYIRPEGGWLAGGRVYPSLADVPGALRVATPVGTVWYGWGCGENHPVTPDQYVGVMMGLAVAQRLVPDPAVQSVARGLIADAIRYLLANDWNVRVPPEGRLAPESSFLGDFPKQLAFLAIGKAAGVPEAAAAYENLRAGVELAWLPVWLGSFFPMSQYYKFNLSHTAFLPALLLEDDVAQRERWYSSYLLLWEPVAHHRNAYFDVARILAEPPAGRAALALRPASATNPDVSIADEVRAVLAEWVRRWQLNKGQWGGPVNRVADPAHQLRLWPNDVGRYETLDGTRYCLAKYPIPVDGRRAPNAEFIWEHSPFRTSIGFNSCTPSPLPDSNQINANDQEREGTNVDFLLAYWLGVYVGVLPRPAETPAAPAPAPAPAPPTTDPPPAPKPVLVDRTAPSLTRLASRLRGGKRLISLRLSERATVRVQLQRLSPRPALRLGSFTRTVGAGNRQLSLPAALARGLRTPGRYRFTVSARDASGNVSRTRVLRLVVRRR